MLSEGSCRRGWDLPCVYSALWLRLLLPLAVVVGAEGAMLYVALGRCAVVVAAVRATTRLVSAMSRRGVVTTTAVDVLARVT